MEYFTAMRNPNNTSAISRLDHFDANFSASLHVVTQDAIRVSAGANVFHLVIEKAGSSTALTVESENFSGVFYQD